MKENKKSISEPASDSDLAPWDKFESAMRHIVSIPHSQIKAKLDAENQSTIFLPKEAWVRNPIRPCSEASREKMRASQAARRRLEALQKADSLSFAIQ